MTTSRPATTTRTNKYSVIGRREDGCWFLEMCSDQGVYRMTLGATDEDRQYVLDGARQWSPADIVDVM